MKKFLPILLSVFLLFTACSSNDDPNPDDGGDNNNGLVEDNDPLKNDDRYLLTYTQKDTITENYRYDENPGTNSYVYYITLKDQCIEMLDSHEITVLVALVDKKYFNSHRVNNQLRIDTNFSAFGKVIETRGYKFIGSGGNK